MRGERDRRNVSTVRLREPTDAPDKCVAILTRHPDVQHEDVRAELRDRDLNGSARLHGSYCRPCSLKQADDGTPYIRFIVDDYHADAVERRIQVCGHSDAFAVDLRRDGIGL